VTSLLRNAPPRPERIAFMYPSENALLGRERERMHLADMLSSARNGHGSVVLLLGEAGIGKSALLGDLAHGADDFTICRAIGVESDMELSYAGLQQLCAPIFDSRTDLPAPQRSALEKIFGLTTGSLPDRFLVGMAALGLIVSAAKRQPVMWIVDDPQWLDRSSVHTIGFISRRLPTERIAIAIAAREHLDGDDLTGLPELTLTGLGDEDARRLIPAVSGPTDPSVRDRIIAEARGNPLALLELPRTWTSAEVADDFEEAGRATLAAKLGLVFSNRLRKLPQETQILLALAAAEPTGDPSLLKAAAHLIGLDWATAAPAERAGLIEIGRYVRFRHPLVRAVSYRTAPVSVRMEAHRALADVTDPVVDQDRRAWHRASSTVVQDEGIAKELERSAGRAKARGGLLGAATLLERAAFLTPDGPRRADRTLVAAQAKRDAGALDSALRLLSIVESEPPSELRAALTQQLRGRIAFDQGFGPEAAELLRDAAVRLERFDPTNATDTHFESLVAAIWASGPDGPGLIRKSAESARPAVPRSESQRTADLLVNAIALWATEGYEAAAPAMNLALAAARDRTFGDLDANEPLWTVENRTAGILALEAWDLETGLALAERQVTAARESGALVQLQFALHFLANYVVLTGDVSGAVTLMEEERQLSIATQMRASGHSDALLAALRGDAALALPLIDSMRDLATNDGQGRVVAFSHYLSSVQYNALGQHEHALECARRVMEWGVIGYQTLAAPELAEAASRQGDTELLADVAAWVTARAGATPTDWALGISALVNALAADAADDPDGLYRASIERLRGTPLRFLLARAKLLYGEWLRRRGRKGDALVQLTAAHEALNEMGLTSFAERARREVSATTSRRVRKYLDDPTAELTGQELQVTRLVQDGLTNREIGVRLYLSPRTVEWHLRNVFGKVGVSTRHQLRDTNLAPYLPNGVHRDGAANVPARS
jgi:DNA-binding CsgD family transcriptional regulator